MNPIHQSYLQGYKECAGKGCQNNGIIILTVLYINKRGYFCESCAKDLLLLGLVKVEHSTTNCLNNRCKGCKDSSIDDVNHTSIYRCECPHSSTKIINQKADESRYKRSILPLPEVCRKVKSIQKGDCIEHHQLGDLNIL